MNSEEVNALLQVYQGRINALLTQNIAFEAKIISLSKQLEAAIAPPQVDGGEVEEPLPAGEEPELHG
tara:strand:- start:637 stop:837 length:201 start_codon:yes stop_codon:yes gene_type:complete